MQLELYPVYSTQGIPYTPLRWKLLKMVIVKHIISSLYIRPMINVIFQDFCGLCMDMVGSNVLISLCGSSNCRADKLIAIIIILPFLHSIFVSKE